MTLRQGLPVIPILAMLLSALLTIACGTQDQPTASGPAPTSTTATVQPDTTKTRTAPIQQPAASTPVPNVKQPTPSSPSTPGPDQPTVALTAAARSQSGQQAPTTQTESTPPTQTGGICDRTPAVQDAILAALAQSACSTVTNADLATIKALSLKTNTISANDVAGLTAITDIDLELTDGLDAHLASLTTLRNAHVTFHLPQTDPPRPVTENISTPYNIPDDFLPHQHQNEYGQWTGGSQPPSQFDNLRFTILPGWYPGYANYSGAPEGPAGSGYPLTALSRHLVASNWAATNVKITEHSWWDYPKWQSTTALTIPHMPFAGITHLTIEFENIVKEGASPPGKISSLRDISDYTRNSLASLRIVNLNTDTDLTLHKYYLSAATPIVEIRGPIREVDDRAFYYAAIKELHLDLDTSGRGHQLTFDKFVRPLPQGTGWCLSSHSNHPMSCTD